LVVYAALLAALIALPLATYAALHKDSVFDQVIRGTFMVTLAMPAFWVGIILILVLSVNLHLFPVTGFGDTVISHVWHLFLPALTIALAFGAVLIAVFVVAINLLTDITYAILDPRVSYD